MKQNKTLHKKLIMFLIIKVVTKTYLKEIN